MNREIYAIHTLLVMETEDDYSLFRRNFDLVFNIYGREVEVGDNNV